MVQLVFVMKSMLYMWSKSGSPWSVTRIGDTSHTLLCMLCNQKEVSYGTKVSVVLT